jgi:hypothetical protein
MTRPESTLVRVKKYATSFAIHSPTDVGLQ